MRRRDSPYIRENIGTFVLNLETQRKPSFWEKVKSCTKLCQGNRRSDDFFDDLEDKSEHFSLF